MVHTVKTHQILIVAAGILTLCGLLMVHSVSSAAMSPNHESSSSLIRQIVCAAGGYVLMIVLMFVDYHVWQKRSVLVLLTILSLGTLLLVFILPAVKGAHRWLRYGSLSFQPSEIAKLVVILCLASFLNKHATEVARPRIHLIGCLALTGLFVGLILAEPDLGQALCISCIAAVLLFVAGLGCRFIASAVGLAVPAFYFLVWRVPFRRARIEALFDPSRNALQAGWQILQAKIAVGSGGLTGVGLGDGQQKPPFLPEASTDFIYAVIGEELGLVGTCLILAVFLLVFYCGMKIALRAPDRYGFYLAFGIAVMVVLQALVSILMVLALLPTKGIALPFISKGGSSLLLNLAATGILLNISTSAVQSED